MLRPRLRCRLQSRLSTLQCRVGWCRGTSQCLQPLTALPYLFPVFLRNSGGDQHAGRRRGRGRARARGQEGQEGEEGQVSFGFSCGFCSFGERALCGRRATTRDLLWRSQAVEQRAEPTTGPGCQPCPLVLACVQEAEGGRGRGGGAGGSGGQGGKEEEEEEEGGSVNWQQDVCAPLEAAAGAMPSGWPEHVRHTRRQSPLPPHPPLYRCCAQLAGRLYCPVTAGSGHV